MAKGNPEHVGKIPYAAAIRNFSEAEVDKLIELGKVAPNPAQKSYGEVVDPIVAEAKAALAPFNKVMEDQGLGKLRLAVHLTKEDDGGGK